MAWTSLKLSLRLFFRRMGILFAGNILWIASSLPLVTLPAATGALFYLAHRVVIEERDLDPHYARVGDFWVGFRLFWRRSTWLGLLDLGLLVVLAVAFRFYLNSPQEPLRWLVGPVLVVMAVWAGMQLYLFPLLIVWPQRPIREIFRQAFFLVLSYPLDTLLLIIWLGLITAVSLALAGPVLLLLFALLATTQTVTLRLIRIARGEIPPARVKE